jgi:anti-sigma B factor antagonist
MPLLLKHRTIGDIVAIECQGRIVEGTESADLERLVRDLQVVHRNFVLDLNGVAFVDSAGLGLLVRLLTRLRRSSGDLKLCRVAPNIGRSLDVSRLRSVLATYESIDAALEAFERPVRDDSASALEEVDILCVHRSVDVLAYLRQLLQRAGYGLMTATNTSDAATLLVAKKPRIIVIDTESRAAGMSSRFANLIGGAQVMELPHAFSIEDAGQAGQRLLNEIAQLNASSAG